MADDNSTESEGLLARLERLQRMQPESKKRAAVEADRHLAPDRHKQGDLFIADIFDAAVKDDQATMEHPVFALRAGDRRMREYSRNGVTIQVKPGYSGLATIHDKDLWIYCISQLVAAKNEGREIGRSVRFTMHDFLKTTNRRTDGDAYKRASAMLDRLAGTRLETNIVTADRREREGFGLVDAWHVVERSPDNERMVAVEVDLPRWLFRAIDSMQVLTLSHEYFRLRKALDRRIYELARKHCGGQGRWRVGIETLHKKSGSRSTLRLFRQDVKKLAASRALPGYQMAYSADKDAITFYAKNDKGRREQARDVVRGFKYTHP